MIARHASKRLVDMNGIRDLIERNGAFTALWSSPRTS